MNIYDISLKNNQGEEVSLKNYKDKVLLVVNVPLNKGTTMQERKLEELYKEYKEMGLEILAIQSDEFAIKTYGEDHEYSFPLFAKTAVKGETQHTLFQHLTTAAPDSVGTFYSQAKRAFIKRGLDAGNDHDIMWNFEKFLINKEGVVVKRFAPEIYPDDSRLIEVLDKEIGYVA